MQPAGATQRRRWRLPAQLFPRGRGGDGEDKPPPSRLRAAARGLGLSILQRQRRLKALANEPGAWKGPAAFLLGCAFVLLVGWLRLQTREAPVSPRTPLNAGAVRGSRRFDPRAVWQPKQRDYTVNASFLGGVDAVPPFPLLPPGYLDTSDAGSVQAAAGPDVLASLAALEGCPSVGAWGSILRQSLRFWPPGIIPSLSVRGELAAGASVWDARGGGGATWVAHVINSHVLVTPPSNWWVNASDVSRPPTARRVAALLTGLLAAVEGRDFATHARDGRAGTQQTPLPDAEFQFHVEPRPLLGPLQRRSAPSHLVAPLAGPGAAPAFLDTPVPAPEAVWWEGAGGGASGDTPPLTAEEAAAGESLGMAADELLQLVMAAAEASPVNGRTWQAFFRGDIGSGTSTRPARQALLETIRAAPVSVSRSFDVRDTRAPKAPRWGGPVLPLLNYTQWAAHIYLAADPVVPLEVLLATGAPVFVVMPPTPPREGVPPVPLPFYFPLLRPHEDYVPVTSPKHLLVAVRHLLQIAPALPEAIGAHGLSFVRNVLSPRGRACYWRQFLVEMSARNAQPIIPGPAAIRLPRLGDDSTEEAVALLTQVLLTPPRT